MALCKEDQEILENIYNEYDFKKIINTYELNLNNSSTIDQLNNTIKKNIRVTFYKSKLSTTYYSLWYAISRKEIDDMFDYSHVEGQFKFTLTNEKSNELIYASYTELKNFSTLGVCMLNFIHNNVQRVINGNDAEFIKIEDYRTLSKNIKKSQWFSKDLGSASFQQLQFQTINITVSLDEKHIWKTLTPIKLDEWKNSIDSNSKKSILNTLQEVFSFFEQNSISKCCFLPQKTTMTSSTIRDVISNETINKYEFTKKSDIKDIPLFVTKTHFNGHLIYKFSKKYQNKSNLFDLIKEESIGISELKEDISFEKINTLITEKLALCNIHLKLCSKENPSSINEKILSTSTNKESIEKKNLSKIEISSDSDSSLTTDDESESESESEDELKLTNEKKNKERKLENVS